MFSTKVSSSCHALSPLRADLRAGGCTTGVFTGLFRGDSFTVSFGNRCCLLLPIETSCPTSSGSSHSLVAFRHAIDTPSQRHLEAWCWSALSTAGLASLELRPSCFCASCPWLRYVPAPNLESWELPRADLRPCSHLSPCCFGWSVSVLEECPALGIGWPFPFESPWECELSSPPAEVKSCPEHGIWGPVNFGCRCLLAS